MNHGRPINLTSPGNPGAFLFPTSADKLPLPHLPLPLPFTAACRAAPVNVPPRRLCRPMGQAGPLAPAIPFAVRALPRAAGHCPFPFLPFPLPRAAALPAKVRQPLAAAAGGCRAAACADVQPLPLCPVPLDPVPLAVPLVPPVAGNPFPRPARCGNGRLPPPDGNPKTPTYKCPKPD